MDATLKTKSGDLTRFALACGYVMRNGDCVLGMEHGVLRTFDGTKWTYGGTMNDARRRYHANISRLNRNAGNPGRKGENMKVRQFIGRKGPVKNQFIIWGDDGSETFQSYETAIARRNSDGSIMLDSKAWDYSVTTGKYRNQFLNESKAETLNKIKSGDYKLVDLNR